MSPIPASERATPLEPLIADLLHRIAFIEKAGTGIRRMQAEARRNQCPAPKFIANRFLQQRLCRTPHKYRTSTTQIPHK